MSQYQNRFSILFGFYVPWLPDLEHMTGIAGKLTLEASRIWPYIFHFFCCALVTRDTAPLEPKLRGLRIT